MTLLEEAQMEQSAAVQVKPAFSVLKVCAAAAVIPFAFQYIYIVNAFYYYGAPYFDAGLFANLLWHNDFLLSSPRVVASYPFLVTHFSPSLILINGMSYLVPFHMVEFFAVVMGSIYASLAAGMCYVLMTCMKPVRAWQGAGLALLAIGYSFNGFVMRGMWMPHFEYAIPSFMLLFLALYKMGRKKWAYFFLALMLSSREDAGLHLAGVLILLAGVRSLRARAISIPKDEIILIGVTAGYSLFAIAMVVALHHIYNVAGSTFQNIYTGKPPYYTHLTWSLLEERAAKILAEMPFLWTGFLISLGWALVRRNLYWIVGFAAFVPWLILNWFASNSNTGVLYAYYSFPFVLSMGWPFIAALWQYGGRIPGPAVRDALLLQTALVAAGLLAWNPQTDGVAFGPVRGAQWGSYLPKWESNDSVEDVDMRSYVRDAIYEINRNTNIGVVTADNNTMALGVGSKWQNRGLSFRQLQDDNDTTDTIVYFCRAGVLPNNVRKKADQSKLTAVYSVSGTNLCVFTNKPQEAFGPLAGRLIARPLPK